MRPKSPDDARRRVDEIVAGDARLRTGGLRTRPGYSPGLSEQTPGLDLGRPFRDLLLRAVAWARQRPDLAVGAAAAALLSALLVRGLRR